jgi:predicted kinase
MVGYPGSGKTTASKIIAELTGAEHLWSDHERRRLFVHPTHSQFESAELYHRLNTYTERLLENGMSVVFDTSFNFRKDRDHMRQIAASHGAKVVVVYVDAPKELAKSRALHLDHAVHNNYDEAMSPEAFDRIAEHVMKPGEDEHPITLDGTMITREYVGEKLGL